MQLIWIRAGATLPISLRRPKRAHPWSYTVSQADLPPPSLYSAREPIFPRRVYGFFRNLKWALMIVLLGIYYITPWIRWDRGPNLPDQAVLIDLGGRRFFFFMIEIWPHEF